MPQATQIPEDIAAQLYDDSRESIPTTWTKYHDADSDVWHLTDQTYNGDRIMLPSPSDLHPTLRHDVERLHGPLTEA